MYEAKDLSSDEQFAITELRATIMWSQPFFSYLLYQECTLIPARDMPAPAMTDGKHIWVDPAYFMKLDVQERLYILAHEICHVMWADCELAYEYRNGVMGPTGMLPMDHQLANVVQDWRINQFLDDCKVGKRPADGCYNSRVKGGESWVGLYAEEYAKRQQQQQQQNPGQSPGKAGGGKPPVTPQGNVANPPQPPPGAFDTTMQPGAGAGKDPAQAASDRKANDGKWRQSIAAAIQTAKARGPVPAALQRLVDEALEPDVSWQDKLAALVTKRIGGGSSDWRMPDPVMTVFPDPVYTPQRTGKGVGVAAIVNDSSGSIGQKEMGMLAGAMSSIFDQAKPEVVHVMFCDAQVHGGIHTMDNPEDVEALQMVRDHAKGGGGTSFIPPFELLDKEGIRPDVLVYLTDGYGPAPKHPPMYPVIWAIIPGGKNSCPWGDVVELKY